MDAVRQEIAATARDMTMKEDCRMLAAEYWYKQSLCQEMLEAFRTPFWIIPQRKVMSRIRITGDVMDDCAGEVLQKQWDGPSGTGSLVRMPTLKDRIANAVVQAEEKLKSVREAAAILDRNPDLEKLLNIMQRNHF